MKTSRTEKTKNLADKSVRLTPRRVLFRGLNEFIEVEINRRRLPHWTQPGTTYFITFRLADSVPVNLQRGWEEARAIWLRWHPEPWTAKTEAEHQERFTAQIDEWLDAGMGECHLRRPEIRNAVQNHLRHFEEQRYDLDAYVLMPNHAHLLITPRDGHGLFDLLKGIKGASARTCNKVLRRRGKAFWMEDSYNRIVRDAGELQAFRRYIKANPVKAKLRAEEFTLVMNDLLHAEPS